MNRSNFWDDLGPEDRVELEGIGRARTYPPVTVVCHEGDDSDYVIVLRQGWVKVTTTTAEGKTVFLGVRGPANLICESAMFGDRQRIATITALDPVDALVVLADRFAGYLEARPRAARLIMRDLVYRLDDADRRVQAHAYADGTLRLVQLLIHLAELSLQYGPPGPGGEVHLRAPLSQAELGSWVDTSRETAARAFRVLRDQGLVRTGWRRITVVDLAGLRSYGDDRRNGLTP